MIRIMLAVLCGVGIGAFVAALALRSPGAGRSPIPDFLSLREKVYAELSDIPDDLPPGLAFPVSRPAQTKLTMFPNNQHVRVAAARRRFENFQQLSFPLAVADTDTKGESYGLTRGVLGHYFVRFQKLGFREWHGSDGRSFQVGKGTELRSSQAWLSPGGHIVLMAEVRAHLENKTADVRIEVLELY